MIVALRGNPPPTSSLRTLTLFALLGIVRLGPFRVARSTLNENIVSSLESRVLMHCQNKRLEQELLNREFFSFA